MEEFITHTIAKTSFMNIKLIHKGDFSTVYLAIDFKERELRIIKHLSKARMKNREFEKLRDECQLIKNMNHNNIVKIHEIIEGKEEVYIIQEFILNGDLASFYKNYKILYPEKELSHDLIYYIIKNISLGVKHLHDNNIIHRDIKLENVAIDFINNFLFKNLESDFENYRFLEELRNNDFQDFSKYKLGK